MVREAGTRACARAANLCRSPTPSPFSPEAARWAKRADPRTRSLPVIMPSARAGEESRVDGMEAGADDYLVKPFSARDGLVPAGRGAA
jgi:CheY-like chemotaxis protein